VINVAASKGDLHYGRVFATNPYLGGNEPSETRHMLNIFCYIDRSWILFREHFSK